MQRSQSIENGHYGPATKARDAGQKESAAAGQGKEGRQDPEADASGKGRVSALHPSASYSWLAPGEAPGKPPHALLMSIGSALLYGSMAVSMNFVNKATLSEFPFPTTTLLLQMTGVALILPPLKLLGYAQYPRLSWSKAKSLTPVTVLYIANVGFALLSIQHLNIPMYNSLKRLTPVLVLIEKAYMTQKMPRQDITLSVLLVVGGCIIAGIGDFSFDLAGYVFAGASCALQAAYLVLVERSGAKQGVGSDELLLYNAILSLPFLALVVLMTGEARLIGPGALRSAGRIGPINLVLLLGSCSLMGILLNYAIYLCTLLNSALTTTIVGVLKGVVATVLGFFLLGGVPFHALNVTGIALNMVGGTWYTVIKYRQRRERLAAGLEPTTPKEHTRLLDSEPVDPKRALKSSPVPVPPL